MIFPQGPCLYCGRNLEPASEEHVISEGLGCRATLKDCVCRQCNSDFGETFEAELVNGLVFYRSFFRIPGKDGRIPDFKCYGRPEGESRTIPVIITGDGRVLLPPQRVSENTPPDRVEREYRVFKAGEELKIETNLRRRHGDLVWQRLGKNDGRLVIEVAAEFDAGILCTPNASRCAAKYALNLIAYTLGKSFVQGRFADLKKFVTTGVFSGELPAGIVWNEALFKRIQHHPPRHVLIVYNDAKDHRVIVLVYLFSLFPFCIVASDPDIRVESVAGSYQIDPYIGSIDPLLTTRFRPEPIFLRALAAEPRGGAGQARVGGQNARKWLLEVSESDSSTDFHACYSCTRLLERFQPVCPYCGQNSLPTVT